MLRVTGSGRLGGPCRRDLVSGSHLDPSRRKTRSTEQPVRQTGADSHTFLFPCHTPQLVNRDPGGQGKQPEGLLLEPGVALFCPRRSAVILTLFVLPLLGLLGTWGKKGTWTCLLSPGGHVQTTPREVHLEVCPDPRHRKGAPWLSSFPPPSYFLIPQFSFSSFFLEASMQREV